jgi:hypothetical protein
VIVKQEYMKYFLPQQLELIDHHMRTDAIFVSQEADLSVRVAGVGQES